MPRVDDLVPADVRRPGELQEALVVEEALQARLSEVAAEAGVTASVAASVLLEAGLAVVDLEEAGVRDAAAVLDRRASSVARSRPISAAEGDYLRTLTIRRRHRPHDRAPLSVPVRLLARLHERDLDALAGIVPLEQALRWERHSLEEGRILGEWALLAALRR